MISWCSFFLPLFFLHVTLQAEDLKVNVSSDKNQTHEEDLIKIMMMDNYSVKQDHKKKLAYFSIWHKPTPSAILKFHEAVDKDHKHEHLKTDEVKMVAFEISDHKFYALYKLSGSDKKISYAKILVWDATASHRYRMHPKIIEVMEQDPIETADKT